MSAELSQHRVEILLPPPRPSAWQTIEATAGAFYAFVVASAVLFGGFAILFVSKPPPHFGWMVSIWVALLALESVFIVWLKQSLEVAYRPFVPIFVLRQWRWPMLLRPLVLCWWIAHYLITVAAVIGIERLNAGSLDMDWHLAVRMVLIVAAVWMLTHCSLMYLFLAITALRRDETLVNWLWRYRMLIDAALMLGLFGVAQWVHF